MRPKPIHTPFLWEPPQLLRSGDNQPQSGCLNCSFRADVPYWNRTIFIARTTMSTLTTLILIASGIAFDPAMGSKLMMTTKNCLVRSGADISYYEIAVLPEGAIVRTFPEQNLGQFIAVKMVGGELGTFKNITCDIELINTTSEAFDQKAMTYTARKGDKAAILK